MYSEMYSEERLRPLKSYTYVSIDLSLISRYILRRYWEWVTASLIPTWMAPNLITLVGTIFIFASFVSALWASPDLASQELRPAHHLLFAASLWIYSTMDNVDGKQARRTKSSSALGELFDHGCDALVTGMGLVMQLASLRLGRSHLGHLSTALAFLGFFISTWEEYYTGVLYLGYVNGPTEGILSFCAMYILTAMHGSSFWMQRLQNGWTLSHAMSVFYLAMFALFIIPSSVRNVHQACRERKQSFAEALSKLCEFAMIVLIVGEFAHSFKIQENGLYGLLVTALTVSFGRLASQVIYAHLLRQPFPNMLPRFVPFLLCCCSTRSVPACTAFLAVYSAMAAAEYCAWAFHVITSFTTYLQIHCFSLQKPSAKAKLSAGEPLQILKTAKVN